MIVVAYYSPLELVPPVTSLLCLLKSRGERVAYIGVNYTSMTKNVLRELDVQFSLFQEWPAVRFREHPFKRIWFELIRGYRGSSLCRRRQRKFMWGALKKLTRGVDNSDVIVWVVNMQAAALFGDALLRYGRRHIQWLTEYGEEVGKDWEGFSIDKLYQNAILIESEINRARMLQSEKGLTRMPFVLPNKPYGHPRKPRIKVSSPQAAKIVESWGKKIVFLYQGSLGADRRGIVEMVEWLCDGFPDAVVAVMSAWTPLIDALCKRHRNLSYVPFLNAPHHLEVTSYATVGLAVYSAEVVPGISPLNALYCAPNKTFEYAGFGIPLLCNNPPGLRDSVGAAGAAICLDDLTRDTVLNGASQLLTDYDNYSKRAKAFFDSVDLDAIVHRILSATRAEGI